MGTFCSCNVCKHTHTHACFGFCCA